MINKNGLLCLLTIFLVFFCAGTATNCKQLTHCSCIFSDGQGYNLLPLSNASFLTAKEGSYSFYFHPCTNMPLSNDNSSECRTDKGVSLCVEHENHIINLGTVEQTSITAHSENSKAPSLILRNKNYTSTIDLVCCSFCDNHLVVSTVPSDKKEEYHLWLLSPYACKTVLETKGLSTGSILLIYFFVFTGIYFIGGAVALKFLRGATGWEMVPNHKFWRELPSLVKEGIAFTFKRCTANTYDEI